MPTYSVEERESLTQRAVTLKAKGWTYTDIAEECGITRQTAKNWITSDYSKRAEHRGNDESREQAIAVYEAIVAEGWSRLERLKDSSLNVSGVLNAIRSAQERIDKLTGTEAPIKRQNVGEEIVIEWEDLDVIVGELERPEA